MFRFFIPLALLALAACGFQPVYAPRGGAAGGEAVVPASFRAMSVEQIKDRQGQILRGHLVRLLHPSGSDPAIRYVLSVTLSETKSNLAVKKSAFATRANLFLLATFSVSDVGRKGTIVTSSAQITSGYNIFESEYQTLAAEQGARERALEELAHEIRGRLTALMVLVENERAGKGAGKP